jgi:hypothetical protein
MKKHVNLSNKKGLLLILAASALFLQSCCLIPGFSATKTRPCNCGEKPELAANKNNSRQSPEQDLSKTGSANDANESLTNGKQNSLIAEAAISTNIPAVGTTEIIEPIPAVLDMNNNDSNDQLAQLYGDEIPGLIKRKGAEKKLPLGIKGVNTSIIASPNLSFKSSKEDYGSTDHKHKPGLGFQFGAGTTYMFTENFSVSTSLLFKHQAAKEVLSYSSPGEPGSNPINEEYETKYSYNYLSAPILAEIKVADGLTAIAGPELNYLLSSSASANGSDKVSLTDNSVKFGVGAQVGLKYDIPNSPIAVQLIYDHRLSRLNKKSESMDYYPGGNYETPAWNMKSVQLGITCSICELMKK